MWVSEDKRRWCNVKEIEDQSWIIFKHEGRYYAKNGKTGEIFSSTDASKVIQSAVNALGTEGGKIFIKGGTYDFLQEVYLRGNLVIEGEVEATVLRVAGDVAHPIFRNEDSMIYHVLIKNLMVDGNGDALADPATRGEGAAFRLRLIGGLKIVNVRYKDIRCGAAISTGGDITNCKNIVIEKCTFYRCGVPTSAFLCDAIYIGDARFFRTMNNHFEEATDTFIATDGCRNFIISNNIGVLAGEQCVSVTTQTGRPRAQRVIVANNYFYTEGYKGILVDPAGGDIPYDIKMANNIIEGKFSKGIRIINASKVDVINNRIIGDATNDAIYIDAGDNMKFALNRLSDLANGIYFAGGAAQFKIYDNDFQAVTNPIVNPPPTELVIKRNRGYVTENSGTATISAGTTSVTVAHGLATTPNKVLVTPRANIGAVWVSARDATNITINCGVAPAVDVVVDWYAEV